MKIGDLVVRAYSHNPLQIGIITSETSEDYNFSDPGVGTYTITVYQVLWDCGNQTGEQWEELDHLKDVHDYFSK